MELVILMPLLALCGILVPCGAQQDSKLEQTNHDNDAVLRFVSNQQNRPLTLNEAFPTRVHCNGTHYCPTGNTCCQRHTGDWGCCPRPQATCCHDGVHCCPAGYRCNVVTNTCLKGDGDVVQMMTKFDAFKIESKNIPTNQAPISVIKEALPSRVHCNGTHYCPTGNTCCQRSTGDWGCCPKPKATCCHDGVHCCPAGYRCNVVSNTCAKGDGDVVQMMTKFDSFKMESKNIPTNQAPISVIKEAVLSRVHCNGTHYCPTGNTCCQRHTGDWGCCPRPKATCCHDGVHCCPAGYRCNVVTNTCAKGDGDVVEMMVKGPVLKIPVNQEPIYQKFKSFEEQPGPSVPFLEPVQGRAFCNGTHFCPPFNTCCMGRSGRWGCCPGLHATCCSDGLHCCPRSYRCDIISNKCVKGD